MGMYYLGCSTNWTYFLYALQFVFVMILPANPALDYLMLPLQPFSLAVASNKWAMLSAVLRDILILKSSS